MESKKNTLHICFICQKDIAPEEEFEYIKTRRGTELYMHKHCVENGRKDNGKRDQKHPERNGAVERRRQA